MKIISIANDFSLYPMGRDEKDGPDNGQRFFNEFLWPHIQSNTPLVIEFDGVLAYGSSFLDEAFHIMPEEYQVPNEQLHRLITLSSNEPDYEFYKLMTRNLINQVPKAYA